MPQLRSYHDPGRVVEKILMIGNGLIFTGYLRFLSKLQPEGWFSINRKNLFEKMFLSPKLFKGMGDSLFLSRSFSG